MNISSLLVEKKENNVKMKKTLGLLLKHKPLGLIKLTDHSLALELIEWLKTLAAGFVVHIEWAETEIVSKNIVITWEFRDSFLSGFDFVVCDDCISSINTYLEKWIVPVILKENHITWELKEFNPVKSEWNAFLYDELNKWSIFHSIVKYTENYKFPYDNKSLVENVLNW